MIRINEVLPNPKGRDTNHEWIELYNDGLYPEILAGWHLQTSSNKKIPLKGLIEPKSYRVVNQNNVRFTIKNKNEIIQLIDSTNQVRDRVEMVPQAPEDKSWSRQEDDRFVFSNPTPLAKNSNIQLQSNIQYGIQSEGSRGVMGATYTVIASMLLAIVFVGVIMYILKTHGTKKV